MEDKYKILTNYIKQLNFAADNSPESFFDDGEGDARLKVDMNMKVDADQELRIYKTEQTVTVRAVTVAGAVVFTVYAVCGAIVQFDSCVDEDETRRLMSDDVAPKVYDGVRALVREVTARSGYTPVELAPLDFDKTGYVNHDETVAAPVPLSFDGMIAGIRACEEGEGFLKLYEEAYGAIESFERLNVYRYYLTFMGVTDYHAPFEYERCDEAKRLMFRLIAGNRHCEWTLCREPYDNVPELIFTYKDIFKNQKISQLSPEEFNELGEALFAELITETSLSLYEIEPYLSELDDNAEKGFIDWKYYRRVTSYDRLDPEQQTFVTELHERIADCDYEVNSINSKMIE